MILQILNNWSWLQRSQWFGKSQLVELESSELPRIVDHAFRKVPFYRQLYEASGVSPSQITNISSISMLPIVRREAFANTPLPDRTAMGVDTSSCLPHTSSGSTGTPITLLEDPEWIAHQEALKLRFLWAWGVRPTDKLCRLTETSLSALLANRLGLWGTIRNRMAKLKRTSTEIRDQIQFFLDWKPDVVIAQPSYFRALAKFSEDIGQQIQFRLVVSTAEMLDDSTRKLIEDKFQADVFDHYGTEETGSLAWECPTHSGYHINADSVIIEFLRNEQPVSKGEPGELHATCLRRKATPVLRYFTGDVATGADYECPCGRGLFILKQIEGRIKDFILTTDGGYISPYEVCARLQRVSGVEQYKVVQEKDFSIEVLVKPKSEHADSLSQEIRERCRELFGQMQVNVSLVKKIDGGTGPKVRIVESRLVD